MKKNILLLVLILSTVFGFSQNGSTIATANLLCGALGQPFSLTSGVANGESGPVYGCLPSSKNPTWFYTSISQSGNVNLKMTGNSSNTFTGQILDIDFVCYGPFANTAEITPQNMTTIVDCSASASNVETVHIPNAISGQIYVIFISKFENSAGFVKFEYSLPSIGQINCSGLSTIKFERENVSVFPNPAKNNINVSFDNEIISEISLFDVFGKNVLNCTDIKDNSASIDISGIGKGVYVLVARNEKGSAINKKIIVD